MTWGKPRIVLNKQHLRPVENRAAMTSGGKRMSAHIMMKKHLPPLSAKRLQDMFTLKMITITPGLAVVLV